MWTEFDHESLPMRVRFGPGRLDGLGAEAERLGLQRVLVLATPRQTALAARAASLLGARHAGTFAEARMHVPVEVAEAARVAAKDAGADGCVAIGGGSTIGLGKALALEPGLPVIAVPTTYAGSEMTPIWGLTENGRKRTGRDPAVLPRSVIYDPSLTTDLPRAISVTSGINALAHAVEGLYAPDSSPILALMAEEGARSLVGALPRIAEARDEALYGAWLCGAVLGSTTMSLHHKLCHVLGGSFDLPHAEVHTVILPHVLAYNSPAAPAAVSVLQRVFGAADPASALWELAGTLDAPRSLAAIGMDGARLGEVVEQVMAAPYANPRTPRAEELAELLDRAQRGLPPASGE
ncbi:maleylacetate reductase [Amycolatopsis acidicola]|uniref:Maleylacetate reductase n=1 Tax=Amycolatopsis acidicola TaxID=2596893 RepID=A0A5N0V0Q0_9PSEU|nr:maleylacetate reductase [Amycolatopsis acidicola]KAA9158087.1 maleylacetate reductase [Amycolatopsis acidicola]